MIKLTILTTFIYSIASTFLLLFVLCTMVYVTKDLPEQPPEKSNCAGGGIVTDYIGGTENGVDGIYITVNNLQHFITIRGMQKMPYKGEYYCYIPL